MKIAFITSGTIKSSLSYRPLAFAKELVKRGHDVYIFAPRFDKYSKFNDEGITEISGVKIMRPLQPKNFSFDLSLIPYIISSIFYLYRLNPDVIHIYKANPVTAFGILPGIANKKKVFFDTDDIDSEVMKIEKSSPLKVRLVELSEKILAKFSSNIITGSKYLQSYYSLQYRDKNVFHIPNGAEFYNTNKLHIKINKKDNKIIFIGNINRINILEPLFTSIKMLVDQQIRVSAWIIGDGTFLNYFKQKTKELRIERNIKFFGRIPQDSLHKYIEVGNIGYSYMPNEVTQKACSNMKVFQYMQFGAIPLVSNVGDLPLYTFFGKAGYVAKHSNIKNLASTIKNAFLNSQGRREKLTYSLENAYKSFSWNALSLRVEKAYKS